MKCNHSIDMLIGRADGIYCRGCNQVFNGMPTVEVETPAEKAPEKPKEEAPAKAPAKRSVKGGKK